MGGNLMLPGQSSREALYYPKEAAKRLNVGLSTLRQHIADGALLVIIIGGGKKRRHIRIAESDIQAFEDARRCQFTPAKGRPTFTTSSNGKVLDFEALRKKRAEERLKRSKRHGARK